MSDAPASDTDPSEVAFGNDKVKGQRCPIRRAGISVEGDYTDLAVGYDSILTRRTGVHEGTVSLETARDAWDDLIESYAADARDHALDDEAREYAEEQAERAKEIRQNAFGS